jgi:hypothetical protein
MTHSADPAKRPRFRLSSPTKAQIERLTAPSEVQVITAYVAWCRRMQGVMPELARGFHIPNGEARDAKTGAKLKRMGVRPGVLDWCLPVPRAGYHGMWIEFKKVGGIISEEQKTEIEALRGNLYCVAIFKDWLKAAEFTQNYLGYK